MVSHWQQHRCCQRKHLCRGAFGQDNQHFTYRGHAGTVNAVSWQPGLSLLSGPTVRIASGGADATVQVWSFGKASNTQHQQVMALQGEILMYRGHSAQVTSVTWSPDGQH